MKKGIRVKFDNLLKKIGSNATEHQKVMQKESDFREVFDVKCQSIIRPVLEVIKDGLEEKKMRCKIQQLKPSGQIDHPGLRLKIHPDINTVKLEDSYFVIGISGDYDRLKVHVLGATISSGDDYDVNYEKEINLETVTTELIEDMVVDALGDLM